MRQIRQMLRLARDGVSAREIGRTLGVARSTMRNPEQGDQRFHGKATTESTAIRPPVPRDSD